MSRLLAAVALFCAAVLGAWLPPSAASARPKPVAPPAAAPAPAATPAQAPLDIASRCYGAGDMRCVLQTLAGVEPAPADAAETFRLLAMAAARMDQPEQTKAAMRRWLAAVPDLRLDRASVPPSLWSAYVAVRLEAAGGAMELRPQGGRDVVPLPPAATAVDLPWIPAPPRSDRDAGAAPSLAVALIGGLGSSALDTAAGAELEAGLCIASRCSTAITLVARGMRLTGDVASIGILAGFGLGVTVRPLDSLPWLEAQLDLGGALLDIAAPLDLAGNVVVESPAMPAKGGRGMIGVAVRARIDLSDRIGLRVGVREVVGVGADDTAHWLGLTLGFVFQPGGPERRK